MSTDVSHVKTKRLEIEQDGQVSYLAYALDDQGWITLWHTEVPQAQRGQGLGAKLVRMAFDFAKEKNLKVEVVCPFAVGYISKHPELQAQVSKRAMVQ
jgi:uncharacterized protein